LAITTTNEQLAGTIGATKKKVFLLGPGTISTMKRRSPYHRHYTGQQKGFLPPFDHSQALAALTAANGRKI
jgi:hypothetical protein